MISSSYLTSLSRVLFLAALAVFLWVAYGAAGRFFPGLPGLETGAREIESNTRDKVPQSQPADYDVDKIVDAHIFGEVKEESRANVADAPETSLQLSLVGLLTSPDESLARAMITVNRGQIKSYRVGQKIEGTDANLRSIESREVLLDRGGSVEKLPMKRQLLAGLTKAVDTGAAASSSPAGLNSSGGRTSNPNSGLTKENSFPF